MTLHDAGFPVAVNDRNDLLMEGRKISGSAYRETADRSFHHATLLFTADLDRLDRYLKPRAKFQRAKGVASVRSPVARLADLDPSYLMEDFITAFAARTAPDKPVKAFSEEDATGHPEIAEQRKRWKAWDWVFGASPDFTVALGSGEDRFEVEVRGGKYRLSTEEKNFTPQALAADLAADARGLAENGRADAAARVRSWAEEAAAL
jgi:lipoate-protein ligase A